MTVRVLLVEDDENQVGVWKRGLNAGINLTVAASLAGAAEAWQAGRFDAVLLDLDLPDGSGPELVRRVRDLIADSPTVLAVAIVSGALPGGWEGELTSYGAAIVVDKAEKESEARATGRLLVQLVGYRLYLERSYLERDPSAPIVTAIKDMVTTLSAGQARTWEKVDALAPPKGMLARWGANIAAAIVAIPAQPKQALIVAASTAAGGLLMKLPAIVDWILGSQAVR